MTNLKHINANCEQISMNVLRVPTDAIKPVQIRLAVTPVLVAQATSYRVTDMDVWMLMNVQMVQTCVLRTA